MLTADGTYLWHASALFGDVLNCSAAEIAASQAALEPGKRQRCMLRLPLPGSSRKQALLLLHCLYAWDRKAWALGLQPWELVELATVGNKFSVLQVLQLADSCLVQTCHHTSLDSEASHPGAWLTPENAAAMYQAAGTMQLACFRVHVGAYLGLHSQDVSEDGLDAGTAAVLLGARARCSKMREQIRVLREEARSNRAARQ